METKVSAIDNGSFFNALHLFICRYERQITPSVLLSDIPMEEGKSIPDMLGISGKKFTAQLIAEKFGMKSQFIRKNYRGNPSRRRSLHLLYERRNSGCRGFI